MEEVVKISALALVAACLCLVIKGHSGVMALLVSLAACTMIFLTSFRFLSPLIELVEKLRSLTGLSDTVTAPMIKVAGIGILTQIAGAVCEDAGEKTLGNAVEIGGAILSLFVTVPILSAVLDMLEQLLGGRG